jgi:hypothetical protein
MGGIFRTRYRGGVGVVELRVHGIGGTTAASVLDDPHPRQISGDNRAGFFRQSESKDTTPGAVEAYSWGTTNSRFGARVIWLLLLPFALSNLAGFSVVSRTRSRWGAVSGGLVRCLCLTQTLWAVVFLGGITMDQVGYQCGGLPICRNRRWFFAPLRYGVMSGHPLRRVVIMALIPVAVLVAVSVGILRSQQNYEAYGPRRCVDEHGTDGEENPWDRPAEARTLLRIHLGAGLAAIALIVSDSIYSLGLGSSGLAAVFSWVEVGTLLACFALVAAWPRGPCWSFGVLPVIGGLEVVAVVILGVDDEGRISGTAALRCAERELPNADAATGR